MIQGIERILKAAIVDKTPSVSSAALVSSYHLFAVAKDVVRRWANEVQESVHVKSSSGGLSSMSNYMTSLGGAQNQAQIVISTSNITQYHALGLLYLIRQHDRMAITKMIQSFAGAKSGSLLGGGGSSVLKNSPSVCLLIRYACKVMEEDPRFVHKSFYFILYHMLTEIWLPALLDACTNFSRVSFGIRAIWSTMKLPALFVKWTTSLPRSCTPPFQVCFCQFDIYVGCEAKHTLLP